MLISTRSTSGAAFRKRRARTILLGKRDATNSCAAVLLVGLNGAEPEAKDRHAEIWRACDFENVQHLPILESL